MPNRKDVAEKAHVSITVVSRVMSNTGYVAKEKREAVLKAAEELNYRPSLVARSLQNGQTRQILFYRGGLSSAYFLELHRGMMDYAEKLGYLVCISGDLHIERIGELLMDGLILPSEVYACPEYLGYLHKYRMPYVVIGYGEYIPKNVFSVTVEIGLAMQKLVEYLRGRGHQRIAFTKGHNINPDEPRNIAFCWEPIWPLAGPTGKPTVARTGWFTQGCVFNAKLANDPRFDAFLRWVNWLFSDEGIYLYNYGVEGETYTRDAKGKVVFKPEIKTDMNPKGTVELNSTWGIGWPAFAFVALSDTNLAPGQYNAAYVELMAREAEAGCYAKKVPTLALLPDDLEEERIVAVALNDYVSQMIEKFIMGGESFNNWNTFVAQCKQKGSDRLQALYTKVWARQNSGQ